MIEIFLLLNYSLYPCVLFRVNRCDLDPAYKNVAEKEVSYKDASASKNWILNTQKWNWDFLNILFRHFCWNNEDQRKAIIFLKLKGEGEKSPCLLCLPGIFHRCRWPRRRRCRAPSVRGALRPLMTSCIWRVTPLRPLPSVCWFVLTFLKGRKLQFHAPIRALV